MTTKEKIPKNKWSNAKIRLAGGIGLAPMSQSRVKMVTNAAGLTVIEPKVDLLLKYQVREANDVAELFPKKPFKILLFTFGYRKKDSRQRRCLPVPLKIQWPSYPSEEKWDVRSPNVSTFRDPRNSLRKASSSKKSPSREKVHLWHDNVRNQSN